MAAGSFLRCELCQLTFEELVSSYGLMMIERPIAGMKVKKTAQV